MNIFDRAVASIFETRSVSTGQGGYDSLMSMLGFGAVTDKGRTLTVNGALKISAFWCAVNTIANSIALLPKSVYKKADGERHRDETHPVHYLIHDEPHSYMTAFMFWFVMAVSMLVRGNGYAYIERTGGGAVKALHFLDPFQVTVHEHKGKLFYRHKEDYYHAFEIFHLPGFAFNGITGRSVVQFAADNLGVSISADEFAANAYSDKGITYGVAESDREIKDTGRRNIEVIFNNALVAGNRRHRVAVFDEGLKYKSIDLKPAESEFVKAKAQGVEDIARWFNIPLHKLHAPGEGGYNFLVEMSQEYLSNTIAPIGEKIKQEAQRKLFTPRERAMGLYVHLNYKKLLETNPEKRANFYHKLIYAKVMTPNEARELEDMNPYDGGDEFLQMTNLQNESQLKKDLQDESGD